MVVFHSRELNRMGPGKHVLNHTEVTTTGNTISATISPSTNTSTRITTISPAKS